MSKQGDIDEQVRKLAQAACRHFCHEDGGMLNPWIEECPVCGCPNPKYDPEAISDIAPFTIAW